LSDNSIPIQPLGQQVSENKKTGLPHGGGPYIGTVMVVSDQTFMGKVWCWIPEISRSDPQDKDKWIGCNYASPFYGKTNLVNADDAADISNTTQSYGMWFVPPDVGVQVMVMFANGDAAQGYWIACIPDVNLNHMIPGIAHRGATTGSAPTSEPVTEYSKSKVPSEGSFNPSITADAAKTPPHLVQQSILETQGLAGDEARGITTSTARRESPSNVYGISTPGPITKRKNANPSSGIDYYTVTGRKGGHQLVMDDGDLEGHNQLVRIRSSAGAQILLNDTIGSVYIINQLGTAWIELTNKGRIDVYGKDSISVHSENDINLTADNNMNFLASNSFNVVSPTINMEAVDINLFGKGSIRNKTPNFIVSADSISFNTSSGAGGGASSSPGTGIRMSSSQQIEFVAMENILIQSAANIETVATGKIVQSAQGNLALNAMGQLQFNGVAGIYEETKLGSGTIAQFTKDVDKDFTGGDNSGRKHPVTGWTGKTNWYDGAADKPTHVLSPARDSGVVEIQKKFTSGKEASHASVTPQHEPWSGHEVLFKGGGGGASSAALGETTGDSAVNSGGSAAAGASPTSTDTPVVAATTPTATTATTTVGAGSPANISAGAAVANVTAATPLAGTGTANILSSARTATQSVTAQATSLVPNVLGAASTASGAITGALSKAKSAAAGLSGPAADAAAASLPSALSGSTASSATATAQPEPPKPVPATAGESIATVNESSLPEGSPTTGRGRGYNVQSVTAIKSVEGFIEPALNSTLTEMIVELKIKWPEFREVMAARTSNGRYTIVNGTGCVGRYQFVPEAFYQLGVLTTNPGRPPYGVYTDTKIKVAAWSWTPADQEITVRSTTGGVAGKPIFSTPGSPQLGPATLEGFLLDTALQEKMAIFGIWSTFKTLQKVGVITDKSSLAEIGGWLMAAYLGTGQVRNDPKFYTDQDISSKDLIEAMGSGPMGGGITGLHAWWKRAKFDPATHPGLDPLGKNMYSYYILGSKSQA